MTKNYYDILGISRNSSKDDIKRAFHKLAHKYHPDKKGGDEQKFKEISEAYQILSDDKKRAEYDAYGSTFGGSSPGAGFSAGGGFNVSDFDLNDIFSEIFQGGGFSPGGGRGVRVKRGRDISVDIQISFKEAIFGTERKILINKISKCEHCGGKRAEPGSNLIKCTNCNGQGQVHETRRSFIGSFTSVRDCPKCNGIGEVPDKACKKCAGAGVTKNNEEVKIIIPSGINNGEMIRLSSKGEAMPGGVSGDLYVKIHVEHSGIFKREGNNLTMDLNVKLSDALLGANYPLDTLDGNLNVKIPAGISSGEILRVRERGVHAHPGKRGDLLIKIVVKNPTKLSRVAKKLINDLREEGI